MMAGNFSVEGASAPVFTASGGRTDTTRAVSSPRFGSADSATDVLVVGAGLIGAAATLGAARAGLRVGWVALSAPSAPAAPVPADGWDSRVYAVSPGSIDWLAEVGAWDGVDLSRTCDVLSMQISGDDGEAQIAFDTRVARRSRLAVICEADNLARGLERALDAAGDAVIRISGQVTDLRLGERNASIGLDSGRTLRAPLVIAADGAGSFLREQAGIAVKRRDYGHTAVVANFRCTAPHHGIARQWFFGDAVLALLPLPGGLRSMVWSCEDGHAAFLLELAPDALAQEVERVTGGEAGRLETLTGARGFPLRLQHVAQLVMPRLALVGDAAHMVHPLAGQGMNLGFGDCRELAKVLCDRGPQRDVGDFALLRRYERARAEPIAAMRLATDGLFRLFASDLPGLPRLRNLGLGWIDRSSMLKRGLIAAAIA